MSKTYRILMISLLVLATSVWLGATGVAPTAVVAQVSQVAPAEATAPAVAAQAETPAPPAAPQAGPKVVMGSGSGFGYGSGGSYLGIDSMDVTKERMADLKLKEERGVEVLMVDSDAPAGKAGLKEHDVILEFNGTRLESVEQLRRLIRETPAGRAVTLGISREGAPMTLTATLAERSKHYSFSYSLPRAPKAPKPPKAPKVEMPEMREFSFVLAGSSRSGLLVENLTPQLGEFFGAKDGAGVLVRSVEKGSPAEAAGFKAGDIIIRVEQENVADRGDWRSTMRTHRSGKVSIGIIRDKKEQTLSLALPEAKEQSSVWRMLDPEEMEFDVPDLDELEDMEIEINRLGPELERLKPKMELLKKQLSGQLTASLAQSRDELRKAAELAREQARDQQRDLRRAQLETVRAARQAQQDALRGARQAQQDARRALEKARQEMLRKSEMF